MARLMVMGIALIAVLSSGCAQKLANYDYDPKFSFEGYQSYALQQSEKQTGPHQQGHGVRAPNPGIQGRVPFQKSIEHVRAPRALPSGMTLERGTLHSVRSEVKVTRSEPKLGSVGFRPPGSREAEGNARVDGAPQPRTVDATGAYLPS